MDLTALSGVDLASAYSTPTISSGLSDGKDSLIINSDDNKSAFSTLFDSAVNMVQETNDYSNAAEEEENKYALGESDQLFMIYRLPSRKQIFRYSTQLR